MFWRFFFLLVLVSGFPADAQFDRLPPEEPEPRFRIYPGLSEGSPVYRHGAWIPVSIEIENPTDRRIEGNLRIVPFADSIGNLEEFHIDLPIRFAPAQRKIIRILGRFSDWTEDLNLYFDREKVASVGIREMDETERMVVVLSDDPKGYRTLEEWGGKTEDSGPKRLISVSLLNHPERLPDRVEGYETVTMLVWDGLRMSRPVPEQEDALIDFVRMGGTVFFGLGDSASRLGNLEWDDWIGPLPDESRAFAVEGRLQTGSINSEAHKLLTGLVEWNTIPVSTTQESSSGTRRNFLIAHGELPGEVCLALNGVPLVYRKRLGAGTVFISRLSWADFLSLGKPSILFWKYVVQRLRGRPPTLSQKWSLLSPIEDYLRVSLVGKLPGPLFIGLFLGLYSFFAIPVSYFFFRNRKRREFAWLLLPPLAILFSYCAYYLGAIRQKGGVVQREISLAFQPAGCSLARCQSMVAVYSPKRKEFQLRTPGGRPLPLPVNSDGTVDLGMESLSLLYRQTTTAGLYTAERESLFVGFWGSNELTQEVTLDLGGPIVATATEVSETEFRLSVHNRTRFDLTDVLIVRNDRYREVGPVPSGGRLESRSIALGDTEGSEWDLDEVWRNRSVPVGWRVTNLIDLPLDEFLSDFAKPVLGTFAVFASSAGTVPLEEYASYDTSQRGVFLLAEVESSLFPVELKNESVSDKQARSLILTPINIDETKGLSDGDR